MTSEVRAEITRRIDSRVAASGGIEDEELCGLIDEVMLDRQYVACTVSEKAELRRDIFNSIKRLDIIQNLLDDDNL